MTRDRFALASCTPERWLQPISVLARFFDGKEEVNLFEPLEQLTTVDFEAALALDVSKAVTVTLRRDESPTTYLAEAAALQWIKCPKREARQDGPGKNTLVAFKWLIDFTKEPEHRVDLFKEIPHLRFETVTTDPGIPAFLRERTRALNSDHKSAYTGMSNIPAGLHIIPGCPGAGKTHWNLTVAANAISRRAINGVSVKVLYIIDVNSPVDDVAERMYSLCRQAGLNRLVIRMRGWPREMRNSTSLDSKDFKGTSR